jgi:hypothetical protein
MVQVEELCAADNCSSDVPNGGWSCLDEDDYGVMYSIEGLPESFYDSDDLASGKSILMVSNAVKVKDDESKGNMVYVSPSALVETKIHEERKLAQVQGTSTVLVIHVTDANGNTPPQTASKLADDVFLDTVNLVRNFGLPIQK